MTDRMAHGWHGGTPVQKGLKIAAFAVLGVAGAGLFALAFGWFVMILWNWIMPAVFHLGVITYWQAFGIVVLAKILFGSVGGRHGGGGHPRHGPGKGSYDAWWRSEGREAYRRYREGAGETPEDASATT